MPTSIQSNNNSQLLYFINNTEGKKAKMVLINSEGQVVTERTVKWKQKSWGINYKQLPFHNCYGKVYAFVKRSDLKKIAQDLKNSETSPSSRKVDKYVLGYATQYKGW